MESGIYSIRNIENGKFYIGSAVRLSERKRDHYKRLRTNRHENGLLQNSWNKYGENAFQFIILEEVDDMGALIPREQNWIDKTGATNRAIGFNICPVAGNTRGWRATPEQRKRNSEARLGKSLTDEHRAAISAAQMGKKRTPEAAAACAAGHIGLKHSAESKAKIAAAATGRKISEETRIKLSARIGRVVSAETRAKISATKTGSRMSAESRVKMSVHSRWHGGRAAT